MERIQKPFELRVRRIMRHRRTLARGFKLMVNSDNLIVPYPYNPALQFPWKALMMVAMVGLGFKAYVRTSLDETAYDSKLNVLSQGHPLEQAGAWVMQPDPASEAMAVVIRRMRG